MILFKLAFRNIFRNFRRTFFTMIAIAVGLALLITLDSYMKGLDVKTFEKIIELETGHIKVFPAGYKNDKDNLPLDDLISPKKVIPIFLSDPDVAGITPRVNFRITISNGMDQFPGIGIGMDPAQDGKVFTLKQWVSSGEYLSSNDEAMLVGIDLAKDFSVKVQDSLTVLCRTKYSTFQALDLVIKGTIKSNNYAIDMNAIIIPLSLAQSSLDLGEGVTEIDIKLKDPSKIDAFKKKYEGKLSGLELWTWKEVSEETIEHSESHARGKMVIFAVLIIIALIGISNTILINVFERTREIGMMAAMGMKRNDIVKLFIIEGTMIGFIGSIAGCLAGYLLVAFWATRVGFDMDFMMRQFGNIGYRTGLFLGAWNPAIFLNCFLFGVIVSALTSLYPALVAAKMQPTEALRKY